MALRYYGNRTWHYRYCGPQAKWPAGHLIAGDLYLGPDAGVGSLSRSCTASTITPNERL